MTRCGETAAELPTRRTQYPDIMIDSLKVVEVLGLVRYGLIPTRTGTGTAVPVPVPVSMCYQLYLVQATTFVQHSYMPHVRGTSGSHRQHWQ